MTSGRCSTGNCSKTGATWNCIVTEWCLSWSILTVGELQVRDKACPYFRGPDRTTVRIGRLMGP
jgi:hypothetical protein